jgi:hypothetical protein
MLESLKIIVAWISAIGFTWWQATILIVIIGILLLIYTKRINSIWDLFKKKSNKLSCFNCMQIAENKKKVYLANVERIENTIIKNQLVFSEQKLIEVLFIFIENFSKEFKGSLDTDEIFTFLSYLLKRFASDEALSVKIQDAINKLGDDKEILQKKLYWCMIFEGLEMGVKDELRRSFKENGFHDISEDEFKSYLQARYNIISSMMKQQVINTYPKNGMVVTEEQILNQVENLTPKINVILTEIYTKARKIKNDAVLEVKTLTEEFEKDMLSFQESLNNE